MAEKQYCGKAKVKRFDNGGEIYKIGIVANQLPAPNEKGYINLCLQKMRQPDKYGNEYTVYVDDWKPAAATRNNDDVPF
jgi:hypothetical protein